MSSPLARPRPGEPRYFVKRSPGGVSPAKMMSREEAAEMIFCRFLRDLKIRTTRLWLYCTYIYIFIHV